MFSKCIVTNWLSIITIRMNFHLEKPADIFYAAATVHASYSIQQLNIYYQYQGYMYRCDANDWCWSMLNNTIMM